MKCEVIPEQLRALALLPNSLDQKCICHIVWQRKCSVAGALQEVRISVTGFAKSCVQFHNSAENPAGTLPLQTVYWDLLFFFGVLLIRIWMCVHSLNDLCNQRLCHLGKCWLEEWSKDRQTLISFEMGKLETLMNRSLAFISTGFIKLLGKNKQKTNIEKKTQKNPTNQTKATTKNKYWKTLKQTFLCICLDVNDELICC